MNDFFEMSRASGEDPSTEFAVQFEQVYGELKRLARRQLARNTSATLNTTGLVHEAYVKLVRSDGLRLHSQAHFFSLAAKAMRQIAIDHARASAAVKRGGAARAVELDEMLVSDAPDPAALIQLDTALSDLQTREPRLAELIEMHYFAGLSMGEIAQLRDTPDRTLSREWRRAKAYLYEALNELGNK